jgi:hypothetical protein
VAISMFRLRLLTVTRQPQIGQHMQAKSVQSKIIPKSVEVKPWQLLLNIMQPVKTELC